MKRWIALAPLAVLIVAAIMFAGWSLHRKSHVEPDAMVGKPLPAISLPRLEGGPAEPLSATIKGPALINIFGSWCASCQIEHPRLIALQKQGIKIIGIAIKDEPDKTAAFLTTLGDPFELVLIDRTYQAGIEFGISGAPETFVVDSKGMIVAKRTGAIETQAQADALLAALHKAERGAG